MILEDFELKRENVNRIMIYPATCGTYREAVDLDFELLPQDLLK